jgi:hypothetical protein
VPGVLGSGQTRFGVFARSVDLNVMILPPQPNFQAN